MVSSGNVDAQEIERFDKISQAWWDPKGEMGTLHIINPLRTNFIMENNTLDYQKVLDVGCGGGMLTEALSNARACVTGIDLSLASIQVAKQHAQKQGLKIDYQYEDVEEFTKKHAGTFDIVTCMEMLEHVPHPVDVIRACSQALKPGGRAYFSSINRTPKAFLFAILIGENILHLLPRGSHRYQKLIRPQELKNWADECDLEFIRLSSLIYNPITGKFKVVAGREDVNYMAQFVKRNQERREVR
jgi:2-polyprenyl-6-hydroxyphenyl methylase/3-demethylubiquinone-9 3-methyltransferase